MADQKGEQRQNRVKAVHSQPTGCTNGGDNLCIEMLNFYLRQLNPYSCSVASVATVLNTILARLNRNKVFNPIDQESLLIKVRTANWRERVSMAGFRGKHGLSITALGMVVKSALRAYDIPYKQINTTVLHKGLKTLKKEKARLLSLLRKICTEQNIYIIAHFTQGVYTGDWFGGHISPVGSFDPETNGVFILDVDDQTDAPYWVPFEVFFEGLVGEAKTIGPQEGGYVSITL